MPVGLIAAAILVVNNTRDIETDRRAGKRTLAVRMGRERSTESFYTVIVLLAYVLVAVPWVVRAAAGVDTGVVVVTAARR